MYRYLIKKKLLFAVCLFLTGLATLLGTGFAFVLSGLLDYAAGGQRKELICFLGFACVYCLVCVATEWGEAIAEHALLKSANEALKNDMFRAAMRSGIVSFETKNSSYYLNALTTKSDMCSNLYFRNCLEIPCLIFALLLGVAACIYVEPVMLGIMLLCALATVWVMRRAGGKVEASAKEFADETSRYTQGLKDDFEGFRQIKLFRIEENITEKHNKENGILEYKRFRNAKDMDTAARMGETVGLLSTVIITGVASLFALNGSITVGSVLALAQLAGKIVSPIASFSNVRAQLESAKPIVREFEEMLAEPEGGEAPAGGRVGVCGDIRLEGVSFAYPGTETEALCHITATFEAGKKYAVLGESGSGKSTLLSLLLGLFPDYTGSVTMGGMEVRDLNPDFLYRHMGYMTQDSFLFGDTIRNNIALFRDCPEERIWEAVRMAGIGELVENMPRGLDTMLEEGGRNLSGGERRRLCLARILLEDAPYLILDEAQAGLDADTACQMEEMLLSREGKTVISVMHNLNPVLLERYDYIYRMKDGQIG